MTRKIINPNVVVVKKGRAKMRNFSLVEVVKKLCVIFYSALLHFFCCRGEGTVCSSNNLYRQILLDQKLFYLGTVLKFSKATRVGHPDEKIFLNIWPTIFPGCKLL